MLSSSMPKRQIQIEGINKYIANLKSNIICEKNLCDIDRIMEIIDDTASKMMRDPKDNTCYYTIQEFAVRIGVSVSTLRLWDKRNKLKPHHKTAGGHRVYSEEQALQYIMNNFEKGGR